MRVRMAQRILWLTVIALCAMGSLGYRLYDLQIARHEVLTRQALQQRRESLPLQMRRGRILDRNGVPLTDPESTWGIGLFPRLARGHDVATPLAQVLSPVQVERIRWYLEQHRDPAWVIDVDRRTAEAVEALNLPGVVVGPTGRRYGPGSLARHLVGYANEQGGQLGLERAFEQELQGDRVPHLVVTYDGRGRPLFGGVQRLEAQAGKEPYDLFTTLDARIQRAVEAVLDETPSPSGGPLRAAVVVMDPTTGDLLAVASRPQYDQTSLPASDRYSPLTNRALVAYEPGSVFKSLVAAVALEEGVTSMDDRFDCEGHYEIGATGFRDVNGTAHGHITFREAIAQSCNITFIQVGYERLGAKGLLEAARRFGLGSPAGIFPGSEEAAGRLPDLRYGGDVAQFSFGQAGLLATPVQVARAYAAIANGGVLPPVRLVTAVKAPSGAVMARPGGEEPRRIISGETARRLQEALLSATHPAGRGTGRAAWVEEGGAAGKTGSAETVNQGRPVTHAWFAGWLPVESPRYVIVVLVEDGKSGAQTAAPIFRRIGAAILGM